MKYKVDENGNIVVDENGLPVVVNEKNEEISVDAIHLYNDATKHAEESKERKLKIQEMAAELEKYSGIEDPKAALDALNTISTLKDSDLKNKQELDRIKEEMEGAWKDKMDGQRKEYEQALVGKDQDNNKLKDRLFNSMVATKFHQSPLFSGEDRATTLTSDIAVSYFGKNFKVEQNDAGDDIIVGYIGGKPVYSTERPGDIASFEEAMPRIIESSGQNIMRESTGSGSGGGKGIFTGRTVSASDPLAISRHAADIASGKVKVV